MIDLDELMLLHDTATPGPWKVKSGDFESEDGYGTVTAPYVEADGKMICVPFDRDPEDENDESDAAYIVAACNYVPELVARIRELEAQVSKSNAQQKCPTPETPCHARNGELCMSDNHLVCSHSANEDSFIMRRFTEVN